MAFIINWLHVFFSVVIYKIKPYAKHLELFKKDIEYVIQGKHMQNFNVISSGEELYMGIF